MKRFSVLFFVLLFAAAFQPLRAAYILIPMDPDAQKDHLKAYGITYWVLANGEEAWWLLNYRGGSFAFRHNRVFEKEC
ncbi:MAG: asparagine synthetase B, partial [Haliscomenobacter sp.]|nr:asparagine synthetase B [Haliscomenobacter sp.]